MQRFYNLLFALLSLTLLAITGCFGSNRMLQSLRVSPASVTAQQAQFTATGQFSTSPMMVTPASVSWFQNFAAFDPPGEMLPFTLTSQPFTTQCLGSPAGTVVKVAAIAPMDANAAASGSIPLQVFLDLAINRTMTQESGFVAATAQMICN
jgi:ABC-type phosphate transport system substrate-binding protein